MPNLSWLKCGTLNIEDFNPIENIMDYIPPQSLRWETGRRVNGFCNLPATINLRPNLLSPLVFHF